MKDPTFTSRKIDHIRYALTPESEAKECSEFAPVRLVHDSLPDLDLSEVKIGHPFFIAGMTAGHNDAEMINDRLAKCAESRGWIFGLGSQRREIDTFVSDSATQKLKKKYPKLKMISNLGITQVIELAQKGSFSQLQELILSTGSDLLAIHLNPLQEAIQREGTPHFKGGLKALETLRKQISVPLILKETGSGMSLSFLKRIQHLDLHAIDISGLGGTHWGRIEGLRAEPQSLTARLGETFKTWGSGTLTSILNAQEVFSTTQTEIWASGGVRTGLDAAKCLAFGANRVGFAKPALEAALKSEEAVMAFMDACEAELKIALFCTGSKTLSDLNFSKVESGDLS